MIGTGKNKDMKKYTIEELHEKDLIIFEAVMGSHAYGTSLPTSDVDLRGVFVQPLEDILKYGYLEQIADELNDIVYYEIRRFLALVRSNNPTVLELLFAPKDCIRIEKPEWILISNQAPKFLTKACRYSFAGYAIDQIKKAKGYNKKMNWEEGQMTRKNVLDFCYVLHDGGSMPLHDWFVKFNDDEIDRFDQGDIGLAKIDHAHDIYAMYLLSGFNIPKGIVKDINKVNEVQLSSIPKGLSIVGYLTFNKDAYSTHCKRFSEYSTWLKERNPDRVKMNKDHGKNYDSKNMMHTFRLLNVALEIPKLKSINVRRSEEEIKTLMQIRRGEYEYDKLVNEAEAMIKKLDEVYDACDLPKAVDEPLQELLDNMLLIIRKQRYGI